MTDAATTLASIARAKKILGRDLNLDAEFRADETLCRLLDEAERAETAFRGIVAFLEMCDGVAIGSFRMTDADVTRLTAMGYAARFQLAFLKADIARSLAQHDR